MNVISRGARNAFRNTIRTGSIILILGISIGLSLAMLVAHQAVSDKISSVKSSIGNTITLAPAGVRGFDGGGDLLTSTQIDTASKIPNVVSTQEVLNDRLTTDTTNLVSAIEAGSFGRRNATNSGQQLDVLPQGGGSNGGGDRSSGTVRRSFTPPVTVIGTNATDIKKVVGASSLSFTKGEMIDTTSADNVAVVGTALAAKNSLSVGSTFKMYGQDVTVKGIFDAGNAFINAGIAMPIKTVQMLSSQAGLVSSATITVDSLENTDAVTTKLKDLFGAAADVTNSKDAATTAVAPLESVKSISLYSLIGALGAGSLIILLTMVMIVRERRREVGILKAIGAGTLSVVTQFVTEAVTLCLLAGIMGVIICFAASAPVTKALVTNATATSTTSQTVGARGQGFGGARLFRAGARGVTVGNISTSVGWNLLGYGLGAIVVIAILGSAVPAWLITKIRPAEVMRAE
jgi:putative ABC transport system permease protein